MAPLFAHHETLRAVIDAAVDGRGGRIMVGRDVALLEWGCYRIPGGDAAAPGAVDLMASLRADCEIVAPVGGPWYELAQEVHGDRVSDRSMRSYVPGPELDARTEALTAAVPDGYCPAAVDAALAGKIGKDLEPNGIAVLGGPARFVASGFGRVLTHGPEVVCAATSYAVSKTAVEVAIATHPDHRGRGLAACTASAMIRVALNSGLEPHWNAFNPVSQRLADRLGFRFVGTCGILRLEMK
jgi:hypothetical protein